MSVQSTQIVEIGRDDPDTSLQRRGNDRCIDDIRGVCHSAQLSGRPCPIVGEHNHLAQRRPEKPCQPRLSRPVTPRLGYYAGWNEQSVSVIESSSDDRYDPPVIPLESNQGTSIEDGSAHRPSALSAALRSAAVSGPPVSPSISSSKEARASSLACSRRARATYAL